MSPLPTLDRRKSKGHLPATGGVEQGTSERRSHLPRHRTTPGPMPLPCLPKNPLFYAKGPISVLESYATDHYSIRYIPSPPLRRIPYLRCSA